MRVSTWLDRLTLRRTRWTVAVPAVFALGGLLAVTSATTARGTDLRADASASLTGSIRAEQMRVEREVRRVADLRAEVDAATREIGGDSGAAARASKLAPPAGLTAVKGPALTVTLDDAPRRPGQPLPEGTTGDDVIVHQQDVQAVVNALWAGGAEAMQLMDQRVISTSAVRCVGNVLLLQGRQYSPPYVITAVGPVDSMRAALAQDNVVRVYREYVKRFGLGYREQVHRSATLPAYTGALELLHARSTTAARAA